jgi:hypothetical protein
MTLLCSRQDGRRAELAVGVPAIVAGAVGQPQATTVAVGLVGGVDDEGDGVALEVADLAQVEDDVEVALGVDEVSEDGVDPRPVFEPDLAVDGDDDRPAGPADGES